MVPVTLAINSLFYNVTTTLTPTPTPTPNPNPDPNPTPTPNPNPNPDPNPNPNPNPDPNQVRELGVQDLEVQDPYLVAGRRASRRGPRL